MIAITPLASSSKGNCYHVTDGKTALLLEAGIRYKDIQRALNFQVSSIAGCLISHEHGDHGKAAADVMKAGIDVYASQGTLDALGLSGHRAKSIKAKQQFQIGTWTILPSDVQHDVAEPLGFLLANRTGDKLVFATDTYYIRYRFQGLTHIMVECNYSLRILDENIAAGRVPAVMKKRLPYDFPTLLARRKNGESWLQIAASLSTSSSKLQTAWSKYKKLVAEHLTKTNGNEEQGAA